MRRDRNAGSPLGGMVATEEDTGSMCRTCVSAMRHRTGDVLFFSDSMMRFPTILVPWSKPLTDQVKGREPGARLRPQAP
jgi:hypothetical protein